MAKRYAQLYEQIAHFDNLYLAYRKAAKGKRGQPEVATFEFDLQNHLFQLQDELLDGSYEPGAYRSFYILDPKRRLISAAPFRDRVVHHALCNLIEPIFERTFIGTSYANRKGKGTHAALDRAQAYAGQAPYVLQCDVRQFFPSIDHAILDAILARKIADERTLRLCRQIMGSGAGILKNEYTPVYFPGDDLFATNRPRGIPIGNLTSQFWANVYLNELDQFIKRDLRVRAYVRYVDDFLLFGMDKGQLWAWKATSPEKLADLRLTLHVNNSTVYPVKNGVPFLGFRLYPTHRRLKRANGVNFQRRFARLRRQYQRGEISLEDMDNAIQGWVAHVAHGQTYGLRCSLLSPPLPREERAGPALSEVETVRT